MSDRNKGILYMILSSLCFAVMAAAVKLAGDVPTIQKIFARNVIAFAISASLIIKNRGSFLGVNRVYLVYRSIFGLLGLFFFFYAIDRLPLANAMVLNQMNPFFVLVLSAIFLHEKIFPAQGGAFLLAGLGVVLIVKPEGGYSTVPAVIALLSAFFAAAAYVVVRHLRHTDHPQTIICYFSGITTMVCIPFMLAGHFVMPDAVQLVYLIAVGLFATGGQFFMTHSYRYAEAGDLSIYSYGATVFSIFSGLILWREIPDLFSIFGIILIISGAYLNYRIKKQPARSVTDQ